ncbi:MAG: CoxG family protein [Candidatus Binatia bacterium]
MIFDDHFDVGVPPPEVWDFLMDIHELSSCMPGLEKATQVDDRTFEGVIGAAVGPISGHFTFRATIVESAPPEEMMVRTEGTDSVTGSRMNVNVKITLRESGNSRTDIAYNANTEIQGRLAILGDMILRATANLLLQEFTQRMRKRLEENRPIL